MPQNNEPNPLYSITQVQELFLPGLSRRGISRLLERGEIESLRIGKKRLVSKRAIEMYISKLIPEEPAEQQDPWGVRR